MIDTCIFCGKKIAVWEKYAPATLNVFDRSHTMGFTHVVDVCWSCFEQKVENKGKIIPENVKVNFE